MNNRYTIRFEKLSQLDISVKILVYKTVIIVRKTIMITDKYIVVLYCNNHHCIVFMV